MQRNVDGRRKKKRQVVDNIRLYRDQHSATNAPPFLSRLRNFNNLAITSIGSFFPSGPTITTAVGHLHQDGEKFSGPGTVVRYGHELVNTDANRNRYSGGEGCLGWLEDSQNCLPSLENNELTPVVENVYYTPEVVDYDSVKQLSPSRQLGTHVNLDLSDSNAFPLGAGALIKNGSLRTSSSHAHILPCHPNVRHLFGDSRRFDTLDENNIRDIEPSSLHNLGQNPLLTTAPDRAITTLCADTAVFVPSSPVARALLSRNKSSMASFQTNTSTASIDTKTPPLTPDSSKTGLLSPASFSTSFEHVVPSCAACTLDSSDRMPGEFKVEDDDNDKILYTSPQLSEVKEGKKREQPYSSAQAQQTDYDTLPRPLGPTPAPALDDPEEWYGLEYTLELSSREKNPSDTQSFSPGEHSKSRESWAAIHRGTIHPFFEDEEYYQWKNWHRLLDKQDERRKYKKGFAFKARSKDLSFLFVDEMRTRDLLYWQKEVYGFAGRDVKERLNYITAHCPDPYFPPKKHDLGWYLKRSRSVGCMRELKAIEDGIIG